MVPYLYIWTLIRSIKKLLRKKVGLSEPRHAAASWGPGKNLDLNNEAGMSAGQIINYKKEKYNIKVKVPNQSFNGSSGGLREL